MKNLNKTVLPAKVRAVLILRSREWGEGCDLIPRDMKVILKDSLGEIVEERELIAILRFPELILCNGRLYRICSVERNRPEATYMWVEYLLLSSTPVEETDEFGHPLDS